MNKMIHISAIVILFLFCSLDLPINLSVLSGSQYNYGYTKIQGTSFFNEAPRALVKNALMVADKPASAGTDHEFEMAIDIELARFEGRSLRPFVAIWVENENAETVRTLALWFNNYKWLPDLKKWFSKNYDKIQQYEYMDAVTGATRPAGKHTIKWDGKNDKGESLQHGKYTIYIEVVRERGTYQLIRQPFELNDEPQRFVLPAGSEVSSATIEYRIIDKTVQP